jgi:hypothetical protein
MRLLAALVLLLHLQPVIGAAFCFHDAELAKTECSMPHEERPGGAALTSPSPKGPAGCASMGYCAPAAPAVPKLVERFQFSSFVHSAPALNYPLLASGEPSAPPFHPPRS